MNFTIDIISPATACDTNEIAAIKRLLESRNFAFNIFLEDELTLEKKRENAFATKSAELRFAQFEQAINNPNSQIIWCTQGGYGCAEILPLLTKMPKPKTKKTFIGFSDISALNKILIEDWNWEIIVAPMLNQAAQNKVSQNSINKIFDLISGKTKELKYELTLLKSPYPPSKGEDVLSQRQSTLATHLVGGCLSVLSTNFATKNQINWQDKILFLEDEGEEGERLDRYFYQIFTIIIEQNKFPAAILLGNFLHVNEFGIPKERNIRIAIEKFVNNFTKNNLKIPIFEEKSGWLGHSKDMAPLILGKEAIIDNGFLMQKIS